MFNSFFFVCFLRATQFHKIIQAQLNYLSDLYACHALFFSYLDKSYGT